MKKILIPMLLLGLLSGSAQAQGKKDGKPASAKATTEITVAGSLAIGSSIPLGGELLQAPEGRPVSLNDAKTDKGLLVMFSCNTCPFVIKAQPMTREAMEIARNLGVGMVIVNSNEAQREGDDSRNAMLAYAAKERYAVPYVMDEMSRLADAFGATRTPEVFLFNGEGELVYKGALEDNPADPAKSTRHYLAEAMQASTSGKAVTPAETKSIGCSIKRKQR